MHEFSEGMFAGIILLAMIAALVVGICALAGSYNNASHQRLGTLGNACFANKTCRTEKSLRCAEDGSEAGICVNK